jgi:hypothetical protein
MPNWKKVITSGSNAAVHSLIVTNGLTVASGGAQITGSLNVSTDSVISGSLTATTYYGDGSNLTGVVAAPSPTVALFNYYNFI